MCLVRGKKLILASVLRKYSNVTTEIGREHSRYRNMPQYPNNITWLSEVKQEYRKKVELKKSNGFRI